MYIMLNDVSALLLSSLLLLATSGLYLSLNLKLDHDISPAPIDAYLGPKLAF